tara:strand:+ start:360 stop:1451 length:1092 start_codon:yes stop_codon:yes gene_type:complete
MDRLDLLKTVINIYAEIEEPVNTQKAITRVAAKLNLARGTVKRWLDLESVPKQYQFDLMKMANIDINYDEFSAKDKDQFFTSTEAAKYCYDRFIEKMNSIGVDIDNYNFIEPSAGDGSFLNVLPKNKTISIDIEPRLPQTIKADYLEWQPENKNNKYIVFGNPPFGLRGHLALAFINHSSKFADFVCFILPQLFVSDGKGSPRKRIDDYNLLHSEKIKTDFHYPDGKQVKINVVFQIWSKEHADKQYAINEIKLDGIEVFSLSDGGSPSTTRNKKMLDKCDIYLPSTCFGKENMRCYDNFEKLPGRKGYGVVFSTNKEKMIRLSTEIDWSGVSFLSTNSAYNLRTSQIKEIFKKIVDNNIKIN